MIGKTFRALLCALLATVFSMSADADREGGPRAGHDVHRGRAPGPWFGDIRTFHRHDLPRWREGHWFHGVHNGRLGWWWVIPGLELWYLYTVPVQPYPDPYVPPVVIEQAPPPAQFWYYCESVQGYYPYVATCPDAWKKVPATPPPTP